MKIFVKIAFITLTLLLALSCNKEPSGPAGNNVTAYLDKANNTSLNDSVRENYLDSAYTALDDKQNDSIHRYLYRDVTSSYYNLGQYSKSLRASRKIYELSAEAKDSASMARSLYYSADSYYSQANNDSAFYYYSQAEKLYYKLHDMGTMGEVILYKAYVYYNIGEYELCETEAIKALKQLQSEKRTASIYACYNLIATALDGLDKNADAIKYYSLAFDQLDKFQDLGYSSDIIANFRASCYNNLGGVYTKTGDYQKAVSIYNQALGFADIKALNPSLYAKLLNNKAYAKFKAGDTAGLPNMFFESLRLRDSLNNISGIVASNENLAEYYSKKGDTTRAIEYLKSAYNDANEIKSHYDILKVLKMLSELDKQKSAYYSNIYIKVSDSLEAKSKENRDKYARIEYETDRLQNEKEALVKKNSFIIGVSAVILLFIAAIFIIYYLNSRNKELLLLQQQQKANEEIYQLMFEQQEKIDTARKEEKTRIAMELHDGILNNIYAVRLNLEFINKKADDESVAKRKEFIKELQNVETEIRSVSHDLSRSAEMIEQKSFVSMLDFMVASQLNNFNTQFHTDFDPDIDWDSMSNFSKVNVYRIIQETLQNINKYSEAKEAVVSVKKDKDTIRINVTDNGKGFDTEKAKGGIGLKNLKKRTAAINGSIDIKSEVGGGTTVEVVFPV